MAGQTLYDKLWDSHLVMQNSDGLSLIYTPINGVPEKAKPMASYAIGPGLSYKSISVSSINESGVT